MELKRCVNTWKSSLPVSSETGISQLTQRNRCSSAWVLGDWRLRANSWKNGHSSKRVDIVIFPAVSSRLLAQTPNLRGGAHGGTIN